MKLSPFCASAACSKRSARVVLIAFLWLLAAWFAVTPARAQSVNFWRAVETNDINSLRTELIRGANPNARHPEHGPAIVVAARAKSFDAVRVLASLNATDVDAASASDETALMLISLLGDMPTFNVLLQRGAQVNRPGWTPLHYAASGGQLEIVKQLIEHHAFIDAQSSNNTTPLMLASRMRALPVVQYLIDQGADPTIRNQAGLDAAGYLEGNGERQWAIWMRERVQRYVARYGTVDQPKWTATDPAGSGQDNSAGAATELGGVLMSREVTLAPDPAARAPVLVPGMAPAPGAVATAQGGAPQGGQRPPAPVATPPKPGAQPPVAPASTASTGAARSQPAGSTPPSRTPAPPAPVAKPEAPPAPTVATKPSAAVPPGPVPVAASKPAAPTVPPPPGPAQVAKPAPPVPPVAPKPPTADSEPLFFSRTLSLPVDPPNPASGGPAR